MSVTLHAMPLSRFGAPPLVIISEKKEHLQPYIIDAYIVWPEEKQGRESIEHLTSLSTPRLDDEIARVMRLAATEGAKHVAAAWASVEPAGVEAISFSEIGLDRLHALRSFGLYPGLSDYRVLDGHAAKFVSELRQPFGFNVKITQPSPVSLG